MPRNATDRSWPAFFDEQRALPYYRALRDFVAAARVAGPVYPAEADVLRAFTETPLPSVRAVIVGQDPYHRAGYACGPAFAVPSAADEPPSLRVLADEAASDCGFQRSRRPADLLEWARHGVLLLNDVLTVRDLEPGSHAGVGWEILTDAALAEVARLPWSVGFLAFGARARDKVKRLRDLLAPHAVVYAPHPAARPPVTLRGKRPFTRLNVQLVALGAAAIDWRLS